MKPINIVSISTSDYAIILSKFKPEYQEKLRLYTAQELFYVYKLCTFKPKKDKQGLMVSRDVFFAALKAKMFRYLDGLEKYPIHPNAWEKIGGRFTYAFEEYLDSVG